MTIDEIRNLILAKGLNLDDYLILPSQNGYSAWAKDNAPNYMVETEKVKEYDVGVVKAVSQQATKRLILEEVLLPEELETLVDIYDDWEPDYPYETDNLFTHKGKFYKVLPPGHTSQADWIPGVGTESLYTPIGAPGEIEEWGTRNLTTNPFQVGEKVRFEGQVYICDLKDAVWSPAEYASAWILVE